MMDGDRSKDGTYLFLGMLERRFSANTIDATGDFLNSKRWSEEVFKTERRKLLIMLENGATEAEILKAVEL